MRCAVGLFALISRAHCSAVASSSACGTDALTMPIRCASSAVYSRPRKKISRANFWPDLAGQVGRAETAVEAGDVGVGLLEPGVLGAGEREVAHHVQAVPAARRPARDDADDHLRHEPDQALHLEDVQSTGAAGIDRSAVVALGVLVAVLAADALVAARAERPAAVLRRRAVAGEQDASDVGRHAGVIERAVQLVDGVRAERVADLRPVERDAHGARVDGAVVGDVGELEARHGRPGRRVEDLGDTVAAEILRATSCREPHDLLAQGGSPRMKTVIAPLAAGTVRAPYFCADDLRPSRDCPRSSRAPTSPARSATAPSSPTVTSSS